jgi:hypothetical protein
VKRLAILAVVAVAASSRRGRTVIAKMAGPVAVQAIDNLHSEIEEMQEELAETIRERNTWMGLASKTVFGP